jgi:CheY-like chemotaxis protein
MDVQMPEMDGLEATQAIRHLEQKSGCRTPVAAMTAHAMQGDRQRCLDAGMDEYIAKPVRAKVLFETIARLIGEPVAAESPPPCERSASTINWNEVLSSIGDDRVLLQELIDAFLTESPQLVRGIEEAIAARDGEALQRQAHSLKSAIQFFGAARPTGLARRLEACGREQEFEPAPEVLAGLQAELTELQVALTAGRESEKSRRT